jgi:vancomycin resistance protein YoaR
VISRNDAPTAKVIPGCDGAVLDVDAAVDLVQNTIETTPATVHIVLPTKTSPALITSADLRGIDSRIGFFVTHFDPGNVGRTLTVRRAIDMINGQIVAPGATFSVNQTVGERTPANGFYGKSDVFINGHMEIQNGGGMCQVATTLFNAAMLANLKIVERHQHMRTIPYAAPGRDATVYWGTKDFKFQNNTDAPVYIVYYTTYSHAICALYGKSVPGQQVILVSHYKRLGERDYTGVFYRIVKEADGTVHKDPTFYSAYKWTPALDYNR